MKTVQKHWTQRNGWKPLYGNGVEGQVQLVFVFGERALFHDRAILEELRGLFPKAHLIGCSTAGEIAGVAVYDHTLVATGVWFERTELHVSWIRIEDMEASYQAGQILSEGFDKEGLRHLFVLSDGLGVNGSALVKGLQSRLPEAVAVTGGLAGDQAFFEETLVMLDDTIEIHGIAAVGFYGDALQIGYGSQGGWDSFGLDRLVTRSKANVLYELDGQPALDLYKTYLGDKATGLPATGLLFPLAMVLDGTEERLVRTILSVDEQTGSMTFAGDVPEGCYTRLMKANLERLVGGAIQAASETQTLGVQRPDLALLISCVGRKLVLKQRVDEEVEGVQQVLGPQAALAGFYSYGEICPVGPCLTQAELHNQTMTITTFSE